MKPKAILATGTLLASVAALAFAAASLQRPGKAERLGERAPGSSESASITMAGVSPDPETVESRTIENRREVPSPGPVLGLAEALGLLETAIAEGPQGDLWGRAIGSLVLCGPEAEAEMIRHLRAGATGSALQAAAEALARIGGGDGIEALVLRLWETEGEDRTILARALDLVHSEEAAGLLASTYSATDDPEVLDAVLRSLARCATEDTVDFLHELYLEPERVGGQSRRILEALELVAAPSAVPALADLLAVEGSPELNLAAARALAKSGHPEALMALADEAERLLASGRVGEAGAALEGIASFRGEGGYELLEFLSDVEVFPRRVAAAAGQALAQLTPPEDSGVEIPESGHWMPRPHFRARGK